ncbi:MAG: sulfite exporter TauE/SafE family protein [Oscillospiraceae bacterium]|nr:sulfite exporter TauE/SafE family protein [Oscillospiraceae bacterium]
MKLAKKKWVAAPMGLVVGLLNGFFGAGGGMVGVPMLRALGLETKECHATCIAVILPLSVVSAYLYHRAGAFELRASYIYLPGALAGALVGGWLLPKLDSIWIRRIFGALILFAASRMLLR